MRSTRYRQSAGERGLAILRTLGRRAGLAGRDRLPAVEWGEAGPAILLAARTFNARLGVVGSRAGGRGPMERLLFGSVAEQRLLELDMPCDVLAGPLAGATPRPGADGIAC